MKRELSLDIFKYLSMYLVILCHTIQYFGEGYDVMEHPIGKFILILNMPMFIFISGYFSMSTYNRPLWTVIKSKFNALFFPMLIFSMACYAINYTPESRILDIVQGGIGAIVYSYWFIWVVLYSTFYMYFTVKLSKGSDWGILLSLIILLCIPRTWPIPHLVYFQAMYSFFICGYFCRKYNILEYIKQHKLSTTLLSLVIFIVCYVLYKGDYLFFRFAKLDNLHFIFCYLLMLAGGGSGTILFYLLSIWIGKFNNKFTSLIGYLGQYTFSVYMVQGVLFAWVTKQDFDIHNNIIYIILSIALYAVLCLIVHLLSKWKITARFLLGKVS